MNNQQRHLRRRSPSDVSVHSAPHSKRRLNRSTTIDDIEFLSLEVTDNNLDLNSSQNQDNDGLIKNATKDKLSRTISSASIDSFLNDTSELEETSLSSDDSASSSQRKSRSKSISHRSIPSVVEGFTTCFNTRTKGKRPPEQTLSEVIEAQLDEVEELVLKEENDTCALKRYHAKRVMTPTQEKWNALTMIPPVIYCLYYVLSGSWVDQSLIQELRQAYSEDRGGIPLTFVDLGCFDNSYSHSIWYNVPAMPPIPILAVALAVITHAPFSFLYHWKYAIQTDAILHWSRRMDQAMIHVASGLMSYATSGNLKYFLLTSLFNLDSCYKQLFDPQVKPRRNQIRIFLAVLLYTFPLLRRNEYDLFGELWMVLMVSAWLFATYPFGGWSHSLFHVVSYLIPPLLMVAAGQLPESQQQIRLAAQCAARSSI